MDLSFAKDSNRFSTAVESLRIEGSVITEETIKARYEELGKETSKKAVVEEKEEVVADSVEEVTPVVEAPKKKGKKS